MCAVPRASVLSSCAPTAVCRRRPISCRQHTTVAMCLAVLRGGIKPRPEALNAHKGRVWQALPVQLAAVACPLFGQCLATSTHAGHSAPVGPPSCSRRATIGPRRATIRPPQGHNSAPVGPKLEPPQGQTRPTQATTLGVFMCCAYSKCTEQLCPHCCLPQAPSSLPPTHHCGDASCCFRRQHQALT